ncbi:glycerophosphoryl diester phosphodiesterase [Paraburkholderia sp. MM6662-R1]
MKLEEGENFELIARLQQNAKFTGADNVVKIDGLRVEYPDGFGLARSSNTTPVVVMRFEADNDAALKRIQYDFRRVILAEKADAKPPFRRLMRRRASKFVKTARSAAATERGAGCPTAPRFSCLLYVTHAR